MSNKKILNHKSPLFAITIIIAILLSVVFGFWVVGKSTINWKQTFESTSEINIPTSEGEVKYEEIGNLNYLWKEKNGELVDDFKIMVTSDLHISEKRDPKFILDVLSKFMDREKPDLVILNGDNIWRMTDPTNAYKLVNLFEERKQYWTFTLGNHDGEGWEQSTYDLQSRQKAFEVLTGKYLASTPKYCLARSQGSNPSMFGYGTNCINIGKPGNINESLYFFDWWAIFNAVNQYVVNWYEQTADAIKAANNNIYPESAFFNHIPFVEMRTAYELLGKDEKVKYEYGVIGEDICNSDAKPNGLFEKLKDKNTTTLFFGHDHNNNLCLTYDDIKMLYSLNIAYNCYTMRCNAESDSFLNSIYYCLDDSLCTYIDGVTDFIIKKDKPSETVNIYAQFNKIFDGLEYDLWLHSYCIITYHGEIVTICLRIFAPLCTAGCVTYFVLCVRQKHKNRINKK